MSASNSTFAGNSATMDGGAIYFVDTSGIGYEVQVDTDTMFKTPLIFSDPSIPAGSVV